jgi:light-regulated signal transduction histidine kinase (bacteriophytochrome)
MRNLERANSELDQFAYIASHDLKAPLRGIASLSQFIREDLGDSIPESVASHLQMIQERIENMNELIEGILEYARVGRTTDKKTTTELRQALEEAQALVFAVPTFTLNAPPRLPTVVGPKVVWIQIFQNLLQNAIHYNDKEVCEIDILVKETPKSHRIGIRDNGPGIPPEHQAKIFQLFQRLNMDPSRKNGGVGLAIVKKQIEQLDGSIWVESRNKSGATFWLEIPKRQNGL